MICHLNLCLANTWFLASWKAEELAGGLAEGAHLAASRVALSSFSHPLDMNNAEALEEPSFIALTNTVRPLTDAVLTVRVIKSFEFRTTKNLILHHADLTTMTVDGLKEYVLKGELTCKSPRRGELTRAGRDQDGSGLQAV